MDFIGRLEMIRGGLEEGSPGATGESPVQKSGMCRRGSSESVRREGEPGKVCGGWEVCLRRRRWQEL